MIGKSVEFLTSYSRSKSEYSDYKAPMLISQEKRKKSILLTKLSESWLVGCFLVVEALCLIHLLQVFLSSLCSNHTNHKCGSFFHRKAFSSLNSADV